MTQASGGSNVMLAYYLKFILKNLKIILKGKILGRPQSEIESMISLHPEELMKERDIVLKALIAKDFEEAASGLKGIGIGEEIEEMYSLYNERKQIQVLDMSFDKFFYENLGRTMKSSGDFSLHSVCGIEIDYYNIMSILRRLRDRCPTRVGFREVDSGFCRGFLTHGMRVIYPADVLYPQRG